MAGLFASPVRAAAVPQTQRLHAMFDEYWEWFSRELPEYATYRGGHDAEPGVSAVCPLSFRHAGW